MVACKANRFEKNKTLSHETFYSLPKGFHDRFADFFYIEQWIIKHFSNIAELIGCQPLTTAPLGFASNFKQGRYDELSKTFQFSDSKNRHLMFAPDSIPAVMRWCIENQSQQADRLFFISSIFRKWNQKNRYFRQIGFASVNENIDSEKYHDDLLRLTRMLVKLLSEIFGIQFRLQVTDFSIWHAILEQEYPEQEKRNDILYQLRHIKTSTQRYLFLSQHIKSQKALEKILVLLSFEDENLDNIKLENKHLFSRAWDFGQNAVKGFSIPFSVVPFDMHGSEIQHDLAFSLIDDEGVRFADGGCYSAYAKRFHPCLTSYSSVATGIEYIQRKQNRWISKPNNRLLMLCLDISSSTAREIEETLIDLGISVTRRYCHERQLKKHIRKSAKKFRWFTVLGQREESLCRMAIKNFSSRSENYVEFRHIHLWAKNNIHR